MLASSAHLRARLQCASAFLGVLLPAVALAQGEVLYHREIPVSHPAFKGQLVSLDRFGEAMASLGDLDSDGPSEVALAVGAYGHDSTTGQVWILFLAGDGTILTTAEISAGHGGFEGVLEPGDSFGHTLACLGDLDGDGNPELAVGVGGDDDGGTDRGNLWILFLNAEGQVRDEVKVGAPAPVAPGDAFGFSVEGLGDLDGDGVPDLVAGAPGEGANEVGAAWVLFLNANGTAKASVRIPPATGIQPNDEFGFSVAWLGDLDPSASVSTRALAVGSPFYDDGGTERGAAWILFLNPDGSVASELELSDGTNGLAPGTITNGDHLGAAIEVLGDLDGDGLLELAVAADQDDVGLTNTGTVWVLSLAASGASVREIRIATGKVGNFYGQLAAQDSFGFGMAALGDLDGDARADLAVGAPGTSGSAGKVWLLLLNDGTVDTANTTWWRGTLDSDWSKSVNWSDGLPGTTDTAIIVPDQGIVSFPHLSTSRTCGGLIVAFGGTVTTGPDSNGWLRVRDSATIHGQIAGFAPLILGSTLSQKTLSGTGSIEAEGGLEAQEDTVLWSGGLTVARDLNVDQGLEIRAGARLTVLGDAAVDGAGVLSGDGTLRIEGTATLNMLPDSLPRSPPRIELGGPLVVGPTFQPQSGMVVLDGAGPLQSVSRLSGTGPIHLHDVEVVGDSEVEVSGDLQVHGNLRVDDGAADNDLDVTGDLVIEGNVTGSGTGANITTGGSNGAELRGIIASYQGVWGSSVTITSNGDVTATLNEVNGDLTIDVGGTCTVSTPIGLPLVVKHSLILQNGTLTTAGDLGFEIGAKDPAAELLVVRQASELGTLDVADHDIELRGSGLAVNVDGVLKVGAGGVLIVGAHVLTFDQGGELQLLGAAGALARMQGSSSGYSLSLSGPLTTGTSVLNAQHFELADMDMGGARIGPLADVQSLASGTLARRLFTTPGGQLLDLDLATTQLPFDQLSFETNGTLTFNVVNHSASADVIFTNWGGNFGGPDHDSGTIEPIWGADLVHLFGVERSQQVDVFFRVLEDLRVDHYILQRAEYPGGAITTVKDDFAPMGRDYSHSDPLPPGRLPGQRYTYELVEVLQLGLQESPLGAFVTPGVVSPPSRPSSRPPAPLAFTAADPPGTIVDPGTLAQALSTAPSGSSFWLQPGCYAPFIVRRGVVLAALDHGTVFVDASSGPVRVEGVAAGETVELSGLLLDARGGVGPALVVRGCAGAVLLDALEVRGAERAAAVLLENDRAVIGMSTHFSGSPALRLADARALWFGDTGSTKTSGSASLEVWGEGRQASGRVSPYLPEALTLELTDTGVSARLPLEPGVRWWLLSSPGLDLDARAQTHPFVLGTRAEIEARGQGPLDARLRTTLSGRRYHQAVWLDPRTAELRVSTVVGMER